MNDIRDKINGYTVMIYLSGKHKNAISKMPFCCEDAKEINEFVFREQAGDAEVTIFHTDEDEKIHIERLNRLLERDIREEMEQIRKDLRK